MKYFSKQKTCKKGLTFIEVMVTLVILSIGLVSIFNTFFISLDRVRHLTIRLYVNTLLDNKILEISRQLKIYDSLPLDLNNEETLNVYGKSIKLKRKIDIKEIRELPNLFDLMVSFTWNEGQRTISLSRSAYISDI